MHPPQPQAFATKAHGFIRGWIGTLIILQNNLQTREIQQALMMLFPFHLCAFVGNTICAAKNLLSKERQTPNKRSLTHAAPAQG